MGVYHLAGLGRSIGAVTAAFSYLAARQALPGAADDPLFAHSGEAGEDPALLGVVEALVLFATRDIVNDTGNCDPYMVNPAGDRRDTTTYSGGFHSHFKPRLRDELRPLLRRETGNFVWPPRLYWCIYEETDPVVTFERAAAVIQTIDAEVGPGVDHELRVNLTGGHNIINSALQMAVSFTGVPARAFYLLSDNPRCIRHTTP